MPSTPAFLYCTYGSTAGVTATDTASGLDAGDILFATEDTFWQPLNTTGIKEVVIDLGTAKTIDYVSLLGDSIDGVSFTVDGSTDDFSGSDVELLATEAIDTDTTATYKTFINTTPYRYIKLTFSSFSSAMKIHHVCLGSLDTFPWLEKDPTITGVNSNGVNIVSQGGYFLGITQQSSMRRMPIDFGLVTIPEKAVIDAWAAECIRVMQAFYFVPDTSTGEIFFGYLDGYDYDCPLQNGLYNISPFRFIVRA